MLEPHLSAIVAFRGTGVAASSIAIEDVWISGVGDIGSEMLMFEGPGGMR